MNSRYTIGQVSKIVGIPTKTIRYYEDINLLGPARRADNSYREYSKDDISRLCLIKQAKALGLPLSEIKQLVTEYMDKGCEHLKIMMLNRIPGYISSVEERIKELDELKKQLKKLQDNLSTISITNPKLNTCQNDSCECLEQMELKKLGKGGEGYVS